MMTSCSRIAFPKFRPPKTPTRFLKAVLIMGFFLFSEQTLDMRFPALAATVSPCQYTMVPLQGLALGRPCSGDPHLAPAHAVYAPKGEYITNGKHTTQHFAGVNQVILRD